MLSALFRTAIETLITNHTYSWKVEVRLKRKGSGIGDKLAQAVARLYMIWLDKNFLILLESSQVVVRLYKRYVDDGYVKLKALDHGAMGDSPSKTIIYVNPNLEDRPPDRRTAEIV